MFHAGMTPVAHIGPLRTGYTTYVMKRFQVELFLKSINDYAITDVFLVPPVVLSIVKSSLTRRYSLQSLKSIMIGAGALDKANQNALQRLLPPYTCCNQIWGMTETSCVASKFNFPEADTTGSVGYMLPNLDVKCATRLFSCRIHANGKMSRLINDDGEDITAYDQPGELCIRGPTIISEYFNNPEATASSFDSDGYFKTGDIMYCTATSKKWYVTDRKKELIKVRGFQVSPAEIEGLLLSHPGVQDAAVIAIKDKNDATAELPRAYVAIKGGARLTEKELFSFCAERLSKYKALTGGIRFIDAIPRNAAGKALKNILRELASRQDSTIDAKL